MDYILEMDNKQTILVTGATGMVGSYVVRYLLKKGYSNIIGCRRKGSDLTLITDFKDKIKWIELDILDHLDVYKAIEEVDFVIHAAATVDFNGNFQALYKVNVEGTANIINACLETGLKKLVHISSTAALGRKGNNNIIDENEEWEYSQFNTDYAISKYHAELEVWRGIAEGLNAAILNPSFILGAGDWKKSSLQLIGKVDSGLLFYPSGSNGFVDVRNVAEAVYNLLVSDISGQRIIVSAENKSYKEIIDLLARQLGKKGPPYQLPYAIGLVGGKIGNIISMIKKDLFPLNMDIVRNLFSNNSYINEKSQQHLDMNYIPIAQSVKDVINAYKNPDSRILKF